MKYIEKFIYSYEDFPKKGVKFHDIFPILRNPKAHNLLINRLVFEKKKFENYLKEFTNNYNRAFNKLSEEEKKQEKYKYKIYKDRIICEHILTDKRGITRNEIINKIKTMDNTGWKNDYCLLWLSNINNLSSFSNEYFKNVCETFLQRIAWIDYFGD